MLSGIITYLYTNFKPIIELLKCIIKILYKKISDYIGLFKVYEKPVAKIMDFKRFSENRYFLLHLFDFTLIYYINKFLHTGWPKENSAVLLFI